MMFLKPWLSKRSIRFAPVVMTSSALTLVLLVGCWGMYRDLGTVRHSVTSSEVAQIRSHGERTVRRIENELADGTTLSEFLAGPGKRWLEDHWRRTVIDEPATLYGAVVSNDLIALAYGGKPRPELSRSQTVAVIRSLEETPNLLPKVENGVALTDYGPDVHLLKEGLLGDDNEVLDLQLAIMSKAGVVGYYRIGMDFSMLLKKVRAAQRVSTRGWSIVMTGTALIVICACFSLYRLGVHSFRLEQALGVAEARRLTELNQLIIGLAHEVRNPLNAIRLNLFTSEKVIRGDTQVGQAEAIAMLQESVDEIERVDGLICQLLGYARINASPTTSLDVDSEIRATLQFLKGLHESEHVHIEYDSQQPNLTICIGQQCFRQILLNLLQNACQAAGAGGTIKLLSCVNGSDAVVAVHDSGPGIPSHSLSKIFDPFFSTRENGVGMGLAVVKRLVENAGGEISCRPSEQLSGMEFSLKFPVMKNSEISGTH